MMNLWKVPQIAEYLGVSSKWIYEEGRNHGLPLYRVGRALRGKPDEIEKWLRQQKI